MFQSLISYSVGYDTIGEVSPVLSTFMLAFLFTLLHGRLNCPVLVIGRDQSGLYCSLVWVSDDLGYGQLSVG